MDAKDLKILYYLADQIEVVKEPFKALGKAVDLEEDEVLDRIAKLQESGMLKRISPILYHHKTTFQYNALTAWQVEADQVQLLADCLMAYTHVSHVYERETCEAWPYNVFGMVHGKQPEEISEVIKGVTSQMGDLPHKVIYTIKEWKKTSPNLKYLLKEF